MKISIDDKELFTISDIQKKVIMNDIRSDIFDEDMKRRLQYVITNKYQHCFDRLKLEWVDGGKLAKNGVRSIPIDPDALAELIFSQPDYKDRVERDLSEESSFRI